MALHIQKPIEPNPGVNRPISISGDVNSPMSDNATCGTADCSIFASLNRSKPQIAVEQRSSLLDLTNPKRSQEP